MSESAGIKRKRKNEIEIAIAPTHSISISMGEEKEGKSESTDLIKSLDETDEAISLCQLAPCSSNTWTIIRLNVGGSIFVTTFQTLQNISSSWFFHTFGGGPMKVLPPLQSDGTYFIDRDPVYFSNILNYLRTMNSSTAFDDRPMGKWGFLKFREEATFYGLPMLVGRINAIAGVCQACGDCILDILTMKCPSKKAKRDHLVVDTVVEMTIPRRGTVVVKITKIDERLAYFVGRPIGANPNDSTVEEFSRRKIERVLSCGVPSCTPENPLCSAVHVWMKEGNSSCVNLKNKKN